MKNSLTKAEWAVLSSLWQHPRQTISGIIENMEKDMGWKYNTYATYIKRMCDKGLVTFDWVGRDKIYYPAVEKNECIRAESEDVLDKIDYGATKEFLLCMIKKGGLSSMDRQELIDMLEQLADGNE